MAATGETVHQTSTIVKEEKTINFLVRIQWLHKSSYFLQQFSGKQSWENKTLSKYMYTEANNENE